MTTARTALFGPAIRPNSAPFLNRPRALLSEYGLVVLAALTWALLIGAFALDRLTGTPGSVIVGLYIGAYFSGGTQASWAAIHDLFDGHVNVDLLMVTAAIGAAFVNAWGEGAMLLALFSTSNALEHFAMDRTRNAVRALMALAPETATVLHGQRESIVPIDEVQVGDRVLVRPGERVAVDGVVRTGRSDVDQATITGESVPVSRVAGDQVFAGTVNLSGVLEVETTRLATDSTLARIVRAVSDARAQQGRTQRFAEAFEGRYAIGVICFSALVFLGQWLVLAGDRGDSFYRAMTILVVMSPCALVISTPASTLSALANAARHGILFKGGAHLEAAGALTIIAFDKTGTLTTGKQTLTDVVPLDPSLTHDALLGLAASVERFSEHHISKAVVEGAESAGLSLLVATDFAAHPGRGVSATVDSIDYAIGNVSLLRERGIDSTAAVQSAAALLAAGKTVVFVTAEHRVLGLLAVADSVRADAPETIASLKRIGIDHVVMITGDNEHVAASVGAQLGISDIRSEVLPEDKMALISDLKREGSVAMVGDGVNDAPALAIADLGVAMGGAGTDVALETADMVLMRDDLRGLAYAMGLSRQARRTILQNLTFSLAVIVVLATLALTIGIPLPLGVVGHEGSTIIVVLNGLRLLGWGRDQGGQLQLGLGSRETVHAVRAA